MYKDYALAAVLSDKNIDYNGLATIDSEYELKVPTSLNSPILSAFAYDASGYSFHKFLQTKPPYKHLYNKKQLITGYHQLDICQPMSLGQTLLFYGQKNQGQTKIAYETAEKFASQENCKVVIASNNPNKQKVFKNSISYVCDYNSSEIAQYFTPFIALAHATFLRDQGFHVLYILDDVLLHAFKEKSLFHYTKIVKST